VLSFSSVSDFKYFGEHIKILRKKVKVYQLVIYLALIPIQIRIRKNDADPSRSGSRSTLLGESRHFFFVKLISVLWISTGFNADPDPAFYLNADPDSHPDQTLKLQEIELLHEKYRYSYLKSVICQKVPTKVWYTIFLRKAGNQVNLLNLVSGQFPCSWIRIYITNRDPGQPTQCAQPCLKFTI
jgi:hypothetical protein